MNRLIRTGRSGDKPKPETRGERETRNRESHVVALHSLEISETSLKSFESVTGKPLISTGKLLIISSPVALTPIASNMSTGELLNIEPQELQFPCTFFLKLTLLTFAFASRSMRLFSLFSLFLISPLFFS